jgi:hypothetical protein
LTRVRLLKTFISYITRWRLALVLGAIFSIPFIADAQILVGPVAGPQVSWVSFDDKGNKSKYNQYPTVGFHGGFGFSFRVHKTFFLHTALLYSQKGKHLTGKEDEFLKQRTNYRFIEMPMYYTVEFKHAVGKTRQYKWFLGLGPNVSYWMGGRGSLEDTQLNENLVERVNYKVVFNQGAPGDFADDEMNVNDPNRFQFGLVFAGGIVLEPLGYQKILITLRYELGHSFMSPTGKGQFNLTNEYEDDMRVRPQGFRLSFSYLIDLKTEESKKGKSTINKKKLK